MQAVPFCSRARRNALIAALLPVMLSAALVQSAWAQEPALTPEPKRMTDETQYHDITVYQVLEERLKGLNQRGYRLSDYDMAKARCWIDVSFHEYSRNDRSSFPDQSLDQAETTIESLENNKTPSHDTPMLNDATRLRPDLWQRLDQIKASPTLECAAQAVACAEVELVHAGSEYRQFGWRHANPYVEIAEDMVSDANEAVDHCVPPSPPPKIAEVSMQPSPQPVSVARTSVRADTLFAFKSAVLTKQGRAILDQLIGKIPARRDVGSVVVDGYSDRIDVYHEPQRNRQLSFERAHAVASYLGTHGIEASKIVSSGRGSDNPVAVCDDHDRARLYACLAPNRRVEVLVTGAAGSAK